MRIFKPGSTHAPGDSIAAAFAQEERSGLAYAMWGRLIVLGALLVYVPTAATLERSVSYAAIIVLFMVLGDDY